MAKIGGYHHKKKVGRVCRMCKKDTKGGWWYCPQCHQRVIFNANKRATVGKSEPGENSRLDASLINSYVEQF